MEVFVVVRRVRTPQASSKLAEEELKDVAEFIVRVRGIRSKQPEDVSKTTSCVSFDSSILMKENGVVDQLLADRREASGIDAVLIQLGELSVKVLQLFE